jgi:Tol biopolymer transport system component
MRFSTCLLISAFVIPVLACADGNDLGPAAASNAAFNAAWGEAVSVDPGGTNQVNTISLEGCPHESPDGQSLFFASDRSGNLDIWVSRKQPNGSWGAPVQLPAPVNSTAADFCPTPLSGGALLFVSTRADGTNCGTGTADIYETHLLLSGQWSSPSNLGCTINSGGNEFSPSLVTANGGMLYFSSDRSGKHALYVSLRNASGEWVAPAPIEELNFAGFNTVRPNVSADGREIVFDSDRPSGQGSFDIWTSHRATPLDAWSAPVNAGTAVNSSAAETRPTLTRTGRQLYFGSTRPNYQGSSDLFTASR